MRSKNFLRLAELFAYAVGTIGGFGEAAFNKDGFIAVCVLVLAAMAFPELKKAVYDLCHPESK